MTTEKQQQANLANSKLSTGPRTEPGKSRAKLNALRHGLTGQFYVMSEADRLAYNDFEKNILATLAPVGHYERDLAVAIAQNRWRLNRARAIPAVPTPKSPSSRPRPGSTATTPSLISPSTKTALNAVSPAQRRNSTTSRPPAKPPKPPPSKRPNSFWLSG